MTTNEVQDRGLPPAVLELEKQLLESFPRHTPVSELIRQKLARCIYKKERCEDLLDQARKAKRSDAWVLASPQRKTEFNENIKLTRRRLAELQKVIQRYLAALQAAERS